MRLLRGVFRASARLATGLPLESCCRQRQSTTSAATQLSYLTTLANEVAWPMLYTKWPSSSESSRICPVAAVLVQGPLTTWLRSDAVLGPIPSAREPFWAPITNEPYA